MKRHLNYYFLGLSAALTAFGILFLSTLSAIASLQKFGNTTHYAFHQLIAATIGLIGGLIAFKIPLPFLKKIASVLLAVNLLALVLVFLPFLGIKQLGATRWINIGGHSFQPSEFFKITAILYLSSWLACRFSEGSKKGFGVAIKKQSVDFAKVYIPFLIFLGIIIVIFLFQRDVSTLGIISMSLIAIYFSAGTPVWNTFATIIAGIGGLLVFIKIEPYRAERLLIFLNPEHDPLGMGLQLKQSIIAIGSGGWLGKGLGMSTQKFGFLPQAMGDSMFAIFGEELGIVGSVVLIALFLAFLYLGFSIAKNSTDTFSRLTAIGITTWIVFQAFINIASATGLFPLAGIPLPFFSYGGSHLIAEIIGVGLLLNISKNG